MAELQTKIGLEIHVQLATKSKMFCSCNNQSFAEATDGKQRPVEPNTLVCPVCLALPGALPVANKQAIEYTIKAGLALGCKINKISKFDRKHYFYPDLPKGYQISQYDEPLVGTGEVEVQGHLVRINRIHLEEDAGKLIHSGNESLVDLNRAGTPLMEIVTEPDITSFKMAGDFLRKLQKIVRDVAQVSEASMEKGHLRCDANISVNQKPETKDQKERMSPIIEIKNINSFRFVERALALVEAKLREDYESWPEKQTKQTWGYDNGQDRVYLQRTKEEAADYRYFPEPDLPPVDTTLFDLELLRSEIQADEESRIKSLVDLGISESDAKALVTDKSKVKVFDEIGEEIKKENLPLLAKAVVQRYFPFNFTGDDYDKKVEYAKALNALADNKISKSQFMSISTEIHNGREFDEIIGETDGGAELDLNNIVDGILDSNTSELARYRAGEKQLFGFFMGQIQKETGGRANPQEVNKILREKLEG